MPKAAPTTWQDTVFAAAVGKSKTPAMRAALRQIGTRIPTPLLVLAGLFKHPTWWVGHLPVHRARVRYTVFAGLEEPWPSRRVDCADIAALRALQLLEPERPRVSSVDEAYHITAQGRAVFRLDPPRLVAMVNVIRTTQREWHAKFVAYEARLVPLGNSLPGAYAALAAFGATAACVLSALGRDEMPSPELANLVPEAERLAHVVHAYTAAGIHRPDATLPQFGSAGGSGG